MRRKVFATLCAATLFFGAVSVAAPQGGEGCTGTVGIL